MTRRNTKGFTLIELMIVISIILILMGLVIGLGPGVMRQLNDMSCKSNLKEIHAALELYKTRFSGDYPDQDGALFLAMLYRTNILTEKSKFICPEDVSRDGAHWVETGTTNRTDWKFEHPGRDPEVNPGTGSIYREVTWDENTFEPWEISYAGRKNNPETEDGLFHLSGTPSEPTPIVSDDTEDRNGDLDESLVHEDHINVLLTNGKIIHMTAIVGREITAGDVEMDLEGLAN